MLAESFSGLSGKVAFLLTPGFEEGTAVFCLEQLRDAGLPVSLIGINDLPISGLHGIKIEPDCTINEITDEAPFHVIVLSGGNQTITSLLFDPRIDKLLKQTIQANGHIVPIARTKELLEDIGLLEYGEAPNIISQDETMTLLDFVDEIVRIASLEVNQPEYQH
ncbi:MAG: DJ-1/PfpI family protein [Anaerolineales bacterium]|nr:DJ-1/PfpI family protein [Anaerolineales bacterium]